MLYPGTGCSCTQIERLGEAVFRYRLVLYTDREVRGTGTGCSCTPIERLEEAVSRYRVFL